MVVVIHSVNIDLTKLFYNTIEKLSGEVCIYMCALGEEVQYLILIFHRSQYVMSKIERLRNSNAKTPFLNTGINRRSNKRELK